MRAPNRFRDVRDTVSGQTQRDDRMQREPVDRAAARLFFKQSEAKARETEAILDALGKNYKIPLAGVSDYVNSLVRILDPESKGEYLSYETYKKAVDLEIASSFPDLLEYERNLTADPFATLDDIVVMAGEMINEGFNPDLVIINGLAWVVFAQAPELRHLVMSGQTPFFRWPQGEGGIHPSSTSNPMLYPWTAAPALSTQFVNPDSSVLGRTFSTVVTPYMPFTPASSSSPALCNIIVADSRYLGAILQGEGLSTDEFNDPRIDVRSVKFREYYALATQAEGRGIRIARNVALVRGLDPMTSVHFTNEVASLTWPGTNKTALSWN